MRNPSRTASQLTNRAEQLSFSAGDILPGTNLAVDRFKLCRGLGKQHIAAQAKVMFDKTSGSLQQVIGMSHAQFAPPSGGQFRGESRQASSKRATNDEGASLHGVVLLLGNGAAAEATPSYPCWRLPGRRVD